MVAAEHHLPAVEVEEAGSLGSAPAQPWLLLVEYTLVAFHWHYTAVAAQGMSACRRSHSEGAGLADCNEPNYSGLWNSWAQGTLMDGSVCGGAEVGK